MDKEINPFCQNVSEYTLEECVSEYEACAVANAVQNQQEGICHKDFIMCQAVRFFICMENL